jgi:hypothetical protein
MHASTPDPSLPGVPGLAHYRAIVDLLGHPALGGKILLCMVDGLFGGYYWDSHPYKWNTAPFNGNWPSSLFVSQDPVAIDSVCYDFLLNEWPAVVNNGGGATNALRGGAEDYLHEAALADNPPSGTFYDPSKRGVRLASLGVHEHWNNSIDKQYSRNLGLNQGIELLALNVSRPAPVLSIMHAGANIVLSWQGALTDFRLQTATNPAASATWSYASTQPTPVQGLNVVTNTISDAARFYRLSK